MSVRITGLQNGVRDMFEWMLLRQCARWLPFMDGAFHRTSCCFNRIEDLNAAPNCCRWRRCTHRVVCTSAWTSPVSAHIEQGYETSYKQVASHRALTASLKTPKYHAAQ